MSDSSQTETESQTMRILTFVALLGLALAKVDYTGYRVYRIYPTSDQMTILENFIEKNDLDVWASTHEHFDVMVNPSLQPLFETLMSRRRISFETFIEDVEVAINRAILPSSGTAFDYNVYHTFEEITAWVDDFVDANSMATKQSVGDSYEGENIPAVKISTGGFNKKAFVINCGIHAREWVSPATCMHTANMLVNDYGTDSTVTGILNNIDIYIIPSANPDGYKYTWTDDRMWRKTRNPNGNICVGTDPNRNFDAHWDTDGGSSTQACNDAYRGPSPFSEKETQAQRDFVASIPNVKGYIDIHSYSQMWMYPYGYTYNSCPDDSTLGTIADDSVAAIKAVHGKTYEAGPISQVIYLASGSTADYFYDQGIVCSFAAELRDKGRYGFALPEDQIQPTAEETFQGLMVIAQAIVDGNC